MNLQKKIRIVTLDKNPADSLKVYRFVVDRLKNISVSDPYFKGEYLWLFYQAFH